MNITSMSFEISKDKYPSVFNYSITLKNIKDDDSIQKNIIEKTINILMLLGYEVSENDIEFCGYNKVINTSYKSI